MTPHEPTDAELLTSFAMDGSEDAFGRLVRRHLGLVYSAALRQLGGDSGAAQDVAQLVFTDLARKASTLRQHGSLAGWLHTSTRFLAAKARRTEERRHLRETTAFAMNPADTDSAAWDELRPVLDDALHELPENDREAVLLRFFEKLSLSEVGSRLGVGEDAARKRVDRALDRLRNLLAARGVTSAAGSVLAALLIDRASAEVPMALSANISSASLKAVAATTTAGSLAWLLGWPAKATLLVGIVAIVASLVIQSPDESDSSNPKVPADAIASSIAPSVASNVPQGEATDTIASNVAPTPNEAEPAGKQRMLFRVISMRTGEPLSQATVYVEHTSENGTYATQTLRTDTNGYCKVFYPFGTTTLLVSCRTEGWGDRTVGWRIAEKAFPLPEHVLRVEPAVPIGGTVVDASGNPVKGARIHAFSKVLLDSISSQIGQPFETDLLSVQDTSSDELGNWKLMRFANSIIEKRGMILGINAEHPEYEAWSSFSGSDSNFSQAALTAGRARVVLHRALSISGLVVDSAGNPIANAQVSLGQISLAGSKTGIKTDSEGQFSIGGCQPGQFLVSAFAKGFAVTTEEIEIGTKTPSIRLELGSGRTVRFRVLDAGSNAVANARVMYDSIPRNGWSGLLPQIQFWATTGDNGSVIWSNAPIADIPIQVICPGYRLSETILGSQEKEFHVVLEPDTKRVISGHVSDAATGERIPQFRLTAGSATTVKGHSGAVFNGQIREVVPKVFDFGTFNEEVPTSLVAMIKVEANGYLPFYSRALPPEEGDVALSIALKPTRQNRIPVRSSSGNTVPGVTVWLHRLNGGSMAAMVTPDGPSPAVHVPGTTKALPSVVSDTQGTIAREWDTDAATVQLLVISDEGYAFNTPDEVDRSGEVRLKSWGRIEGTVASMEPGWRVLAVYQDPASEERSYGLAYQVPPTHCNEGQFVLPRLPAGSCQLFFNRPTVAGDGTTNWTQGGSMTVQIEEGSTTHVTVERLPLPAAE